MRPLDRFRSIKVKLSLVIVGAVAISAGVSVAGLQLGIPILARPVIATVIALLLVYPFARGLTSPLREMASAARAMAAGDDSVPVTATSRDEVGELARAFNAMRADLAEVEAQRRELIANVSHELRTPLASLRARFENIVDGVEPADEDNIAASLREVERLSGLVDQLLDLSRIESGVAPLHVEPFELDSVLDDAADVARRQHPNAVIEVDGDAVVYQGDAARIHQVAVNLLSNAARYAPDGEPVTITARRAPDGAEIVVRDRGPGIPPAERRRVFERFYRSDHARAADGGGTGLGLSIVRGIVEAHGGRVVIGDSTDGGCEVAVLLPDVKEGP